LERSEQIYLVIRDHSKKLIHPCHYCLLIA
jgi:hypothetical protein